MTGSASSIGHMAEQWSSLTSNSGLKNVHSRWNRR